MLKDIEIMVCLIGKGNFRKRSLDSKNQREKRMGILSEGGMYQEQNCKFLFFIIVYKMLDGQYQLIF